MTRSLTCEQDVHAVVRRIEALLHELSAMDTDSGGKARELARLLMQMYGAGLARILGLLDSEARRGLVADDLIASLLVLHDLHPHDARTRVEHRLQRLGPVCGVDIQLVDLQPGSVAVRVVAQHKRAGIASSELKALIEGVVQSAVPEVEHIEIEGLSEMNAVPLVQLRGKAAASSTSPIPFR